MFIYCNGKLKMVIIHESEKKHETTYVTISRDEYESMKSTIEILEDEELMEMIRKSKKDIKEGKTVSFKDYLKEKLFPNSC